MLASSLQTVKQRKRGGVDGECLRVIKGTWFKGVSRTICTCSLKEGPEKRMQPAPPRCAAPGGAILMVLFAVVRGGPSHRLQCVLPPGIVRHCRTGPSSLFLDGLHRPRPSPPHLFPGTYMNFFPESLGVLETKGTEQFLICQPSIGWWRGS